MKFITILILSSVLSMMSVHASVPSMKTPLQNQVLDKDTRDNQQTNINTKNSLLNQLIRHKKIRNTEHNHTYTNALTEYHYKVAPKNPLNALLKVSF